MEKTRTPKEIQKLNFNDVAFFLGISTTDAKRKMAYLFFNSKAHLQENLTKAGTPNIGVNDLADKKEFESTIKSCTELEGKDNIDYHIESFNKGVPKSKLTEYAETKSFITALRFTGKYQILNQILNKEQLNLLQKKWLLSNTYQVNRWSKKTIQFIESNNWAIDYLLGFIPMVEFEFEKQKRIIRRRF